MQEDVALVVGGLVHLGVERHGGDDVRDQHCHDHADDAGDEGQGEAFEEELREDVAAAGAEGFEEADFAGALGDGDEHDVHDADAADAEGHGSDDAEQDLKSGAELGELFGVLDGVQVPMALSSRGSKWWRSARTARTAAMALMCSSAEEGWKTMELGFFCWRRSRMVKKGTKAFSVSGPLLEES